MSYSSLHSVKSISCRSMISHKKTRAYIGEWHLSLVFSKAQSQKILLVCGTKWQLILFPSFLTTRYCSTRAAKAM